MSTTAASAAADAASSAAALVARLERAALGALYVVAVWLPLQYLPTRNLHLLPGWTVWIDDAALVAAALAAGAATVLRDRRWRRTPLDLPLAACVAVGLASAFANRATAGELVLGLRGPLQPVLAFYALVLLRPSSSHLRRLAAISLCLALLQVPVTAAQFAATRGELSRDLVFGTFWTGCSNSIAYYLLFFILPLLGAAAEHPRALPVAVAALLMVPFVLCGSRGALWMLPPLAAVAARGAIRRGARALLATGVPVATAAIAVAAFLALKPPVEGAAVAHELSPRRLYLEQWDRDHGMGRLLYARWITERLAARGARGLLLGAGPARFSSSAGAYLRAPLLEEATRGGHSPIIPGQLVATFGEYGLLGLAAFGWLIATGLRVAWRGARASPRLDRPPLPPGEGRWEGGHRGYAGAARGLFAAALFLVLGTPLENVWELPHVATLAWAGIAWVGQQEDR